MRMLRLTPLPLALAVHCTPPPPSARPEPDDSAAPTDHRADVRLAFQEASVGTPTTTTLSGVFVSGGAPWHNLADCLTSPWQVCIPTAAGPDDWAPALLRAEIEPPLSEALTASPAGQTLTSTGHEAPWRAAGFDLGLYHATFDGIALPDEAAGVSFEGGVWGSVHQQQILPGPTRLWVTHPSPLLPVEVSDVGTLPLRWTPGRDGELTLLVGAPGHSRVYTLADDGAFDLDLSGLDLPSGSTLDLVLQRHTSIEIEVGAHRLTLQVASVQPLVGTWVSTADRTPLDLPDRCVDAAAAPPLTAGRYIGAFGDHEADHDPGAGGCAGGFPQVGPDAVLPVRLEPWQQLQVTSRLPDDDGSVYLLADCTAPVCLTGADGAGVGAAEVLTWFNDADTAQTVWLVLDAYGDVTGPALVDVAVTALGGEALAATCLEAIENGPVPDGTYHAPLDAHPSALAPPCAAGATDGERIAQVEVLPNETLSVEATATSGAPQLYLMWNCSVDDSCFAASQPAGTTASIGWWNDADVSQRVYVVVDGVDVDAVEVALSTRPTP